VSLRGREPDWWYGTGPHWQATLLSPIGALVGEIAKARLRRATPYRPLIPVICVGNFTAGGSGKTPLAILIAQLIAGLGREPWFLSRGYGGTLEGPLRVEPAKHTAGEVGDEPLLLARHAPTVISRDRRKGAEAIETSAPQEAVIIMDDGLQNPALAKSISIAVVDGDRGFGNGYVIPAGPLRAPLAAQIGLADLIVMTGRRDSGDTPPITVLRGMTDAPFVKAETRATAAAAEMKGRKVVAYAGIANPQRFFSTLDGLGADVVERHTFADHHVFSDAEAQLLLDAASRSEASLVTTEKDFVRLSGTSGRRAELKKRSAALAIETVIEDGDLKVLTEMIARAIAR
jgi:tetraacyldisaccharide 4'-kinase